MDLAQKAQAIYRTLTARYGEPVWQAGEDPVDALIGTILSANTNDINSRRAFDQLKAAFGNEWEAVRTAPLEAIKAAIRPAGMYNQKAPNIVATLTQLYQDRDEYSLDFLAHMPVADALAYLTNFPGVGHKTASIVLLFCFNQAAFPVDTHIQRISQRLGVSSRRAGAEQIKTIWENLLPPQSYYPLHLNFIRHGREICRAQTPRCEQCPLQHLCDFFNQQGAWRWNPPPPDPAPPV